MRATAPIRSSGSAGVAAAKILLCLFCGAALLIGSTVTYMFARGIVPGLRTHLWRETPCRIVESRVARGWDGSKSRPFALQVLYLYEIGGRTYESRVYSPGYSGSDQISDAQRPADRYPPGSSAMCYVDPAAPHSACLERPSPWIALVVLLPLIFVCVGVGGIAAIWWPKRAGKEDHRAISEQVQRVAAGCVVGLFSLVLLASLATSLFFVWSAVASFAARSWPEVPCVVLSSEVRHHATLEEARPSAWTSSTSTR